MDKKQKKILIVSGIVIIVFIFWFVFAEKKVTQSVFETANSVLPYNRVTETVAPEKVYNMTKQERVYKYITEIFDMLNNKEYEKAYSLLADDFKREEFWNYDDFKNFIEVYWDDNNYEPKFKNFYYKDELFIVLTEFLKSSYTKEDLINGVPQRFETFVINELAENDYRIAFNNFIFSKELESEKQTSGPLTIELIKLNKYRDNSEIFFKMSNSSDEDISISTMNMYVDATLSIPKVYYQIFDIGAKQTDTFAIKYFMDYDETMTEQKVVIHNFKVNGEKISMEIPIKYKVTEN